MIDKTVRVEAKGQFEYFTNGKAKHKGYICGICSSGSGSKGTGIIPVKGGKEHTYKCFSCGFCGDSYNYVAQLRGLSLTEAILYVNEALGLHHADKIKQPNHPNDKKDRLESERVMTDEEIIKLKRVGERDILTYQLYLDNFKESEEAIEYIKNRGISRYTAVKYNVGYCPEWVNPRGGFGLKSKRLILFNNPHSYTARDIDNGNENYKAIKYQSDYKLGDCIPTDDIFNGSILANKNPTNIFVCEGEIDALSILECGYNAVGLGGTSNLTKLADAINSCSNFNHTLLLALDSDKPGVDTTKKLKEKLNELNIKHYVANVNGNYKDPNEALVGDREKFIKDIEETLSLSIDLVNANNYLNHKFDRDIEGFKANGIKKTGYSNFDALTGGLYSGLYVLGAISSLGKTTFTHQMAEQLTSQGHYVIYFSLEQSTTELLSKSISREMARINGNNALTSKDIRHGETHHNLKEARTNVSKAMNDRLYIVEQTFSCTYSYVEKFVENFIKRNEVKPIIIIDYLQIMKGDPTKPSQHKKDIVDHNVESLKELSLKNKLTVFAIASVNRSNYLSPIDFESFKESGGIEYTADVVLGLQLQVLRSQEFINGKNEIKKRELVQNAKDEEVRKIELVCLKNRYGSNFSTAFRYTAKYDLVVPETPENRMVKKAEQVTEQTELPSQFKKKPIQREKF